MYFRKYFVASIAKLNTNKYEFLLLFKAKTEITANDLSSIFYGSNKSLRISPIKYNFIFLI